MKTQRSGPVQALALRASDAGAFKRIVNALLQGRSPTGRVAALGRCHYAGEVRRAVRAEAHAAVAGREAGRNERHRHMEHLASARAEELVWTDDRSRSSPETKGVARVELGAPKLAQTSALPHLTSGSPKSRTEYAGPAAAAPAGESALRAVALIERVETFVRAARPGLSLTLRGSSGGTIDIEKSGPGAVSLRLNSDASPFGPDPANALRAELSAAGIALTYLELEP